MATESKKSDLKERAKKFAHRCVKLCSSLTKNWLSYHIRSQLMRCATSVAAQSRKSFISKLGIVVEEADESCFWIEFIMDEELLTETQCSSLLKEAKELTAIFVTSQKTARRNDKLKIEL